MDRELYLKIAKWRDATAKREGVEVYRVLSTQAVEGIAQTKPETQEELLSVKGIAQKKLAKYGTNLLEMIREHTGVSEDVPLFDDDGGNGGESESNEGKEEKVFSVSDFLELINIGLRRSHAKVKGEISSLDIRERYLFFGIKDANDNSLLSVFMWKRDYDLSGVDLKEGTEVVITGFPEIYKPMGKFSFKAQFVELAGEGALKQAYEELKKKLDEEGAFGEERKKALPEFPEKIGVITSKTGAVIHDFLNNLGKFGYHISFFDSRVEGQQAVRDLLAGIKYFKKKNTIDVLVIMRGGGSLESLQAFNNETLVREILDCPFPILSGIGHDKDVPLLSLVSDRMVSTPTAAAKVLGESWSEARSEVRMREQKVLSSFREILDSKKYQIVENANILQNGIHRILLKVRRAEQVFERASAKLAFSLRVLRKKIEDVQSFFLRRLGESLKEKKGTIKQSENVLRINSPRRQLKLGYSIASSGGKIVRSIDEIEPGSELLVRVYDGKISAQVREAQSNKGSKQKENES